VLETTLVRMTPAGFEAFMDAVSSPPAPVPEMVELLRRAAPWETSDPAVPS
jgi:uncharacterized protein (DUF1778 family)